MALRIRVGKGGRLLSLIGVGIWGCTTVQVFPGGDGGSAGVGGHGDDAAGSMSESGAGANDAEGGVAGTENTGGGGAPGGGGGAPSTHEGGGGAWTTGDAGGGVGVDAGSCPASVQAKAVIPTVLLLIDNSSSMFAPRSQLWDPLYDVLMKPTNGIVAALQDKVRFGFTSYRGSSMANDPACPNLFEVDYELANFEAIDTLYKQQGTEYIQGLKWETPTGAAIKKSAQKLAAYVADPPGPKYILLVTDGNPNTCGAIEPQCGSDESVEAVQDARAIGIGTMVVGIGDIIAGNSGCEPAWGRCGPLHLQDLANAGQGLPVQAPPDQLKYQACTPTQTLAATYASAASTPGTAAFYTATNAVELDTAIKSALNPLVSCTYELNVTVVGNPATGAIQVNGVARTYNDPNGWILDADKTRITLQGTACDALRAANSTLSISFPCGVVTAR
jgi:hypothetical protein